MRYFSSLLSPWRRLGGRSEAFGKAPVPGLFSFSLTSPIFYLYSSGRWEIHASMRMYEGFFLVYGSGARLEVTMWVSCSEVVCEPLRFEFRYELFFFSLLLSKYCLPRSGEFRGRFVCFGSSQILSYSTDTVNGNLGHSYGKRFSNSRSMRVSS